MLSLFLSIAFAATSPATTQAEISCRASGNRPSLSYHLASSKPGELDQICAAAISRAKDLGFSSVTLQPTWTYENGKVGTETTLASGELSRCLENIWSAGLSLVFQPRLQALAGARWRAGFALNPMSESYRGSFGEFVSWVSKRRTDLQNSQRTVDVIAAAELDDSMQVLPEKWTELASDLRARLAAPEVRLGLNPNSDPALHEKYDLHCADYRKMLEAYDFVAPTLYGDWSRVVAIAKANPGDAGLGMRGKIGSAKNALARDFESKRECRFPILKVMPFAIGEMGIGGNIQRTEVESKPERDFEDRRLAFASMLDWARAEKSDLAVHVKTQGALDISGDPALATLLRQYSKDRCVKSADLVQSKDVLSLSVLDCLHGSVSVQRACVNELKSAAKTPMQRAILYRSLAKALKADSPEVPAALRWFYGADLEAKWVPEAKLLLLQSLSGPFGEESLAYLSAFTLDSKAMSRLGPKDWGKVASACRPLSAPGCASFASLAAFRQAWGKDADIKSALLGSDSEQAGIAYCRMKGPPAGPSTSAAFRLGYWSACANAKQVSRESVNVARFYLSYPGVSTQALSLVSEIARKTPAILTKSEIRESLEQCRTNFGSLRESQNRACGKMAATINR